MTSKLCWVAVAALAFAGCKKEKDKSGSVDDGTGAPERDGSALWKLAPEGTRAGVVIAAGAGVELHRGFVEVVKALQKTPMGGPLVAKMLAKPQAEGIDILSADSFRDKGFDLALGAAVFTDSSEEPFIIMPVSDRAKFRATAKGTEKDGVDVFDGGDMVCAPSGNHYRCAKSAARLAAWKPAQKPVDDGWPTALRGSIEFMVDGSLLADAEPIAEGMDQASLLRGAVRLQRGAALAQFSVSGAPKAFLRVGDTPLADAAKKGKPAGLLIGYGAALIELIRAEQGSRLDEPGPLGMTPRKVLDAFTGEVVAFAPAGDPARGYVELGIKDPAPFKALMPLCAMAPPIPGVEVKSSNDGCSATIGPPASPVAVTVDLKVTDRALVASVGDTSKGRDGEGPALPGYLANHKWLGALWGRGLVVGSLANIPPQQLQSMINQVPDMKLGLWAYAHITEFGMGLRTDDKGAHGFVRLATTWQNKPEIVAELEPLLIKLAEGDLGAIKAVQDLARKHADSPLGASASLGGSSGAIGGAAIGVMAAVAIPSFMKYTKKSKTSEARMFVKKLYDGARAYYLDPPASAGFGAAEASYPKKSTAITPPLGTCCQNPDGKCLPDARLWTDQTWVQLQFSVDDPHYYSYQYQVAPDGKSFTVRAFGDLDCDGDYSTFEMVGDANAAGNVGLYREKELE